jgi:hypothetical protein
MSDISTIHKTNENSKVDPTEQEWLAHVREYHIFNDAQARLIADALRDVQTYTREERDIVLDDMVGVLRDWQEGVNLELDKLCCELQTYRERVASLEGQLQAMKDLKGVPGKQGERGEAWRNRQARCARRERRDRRRRQERIALDWRQGGRLQSDNGDERWHARAAHLA